MIQKALAGALCLLTGLLLAAPARAQDAAGFEKEWGAIERQMKAGRWKRVKKGLDRALEAHREQAYVLARRTEIVQAYERATFALAHPAPPLQKLVAGKLHSGNLKTGRIKITYKVGSWGKDWERAEDRRFFMPKMAGPFEVILEGRRYPGIRSSIGNTGVPTIYAPWDRSDGFLSVFGLPESNVGMQKVSVPARFFRMKGGETELLDDKGQTPARPGKRFKLRVRVKKSSVTALYGSKQLFSARKSKKLYGYVGYSGRGVDTVTIDGIVEPSWLQSRLDAHQQKARVTFAKTWKPKQALPAWLFSRVSASAGAEKRSGDAGLWPQKLPRKVRRQAARALARSRSGLATKALREFEKLGEDGVPEPTRSFVLAAIRLELNEPTKALELADNVIALAPEFLRGHTLRAVILADLGRRKEATGSLEAVAAKHPGHEEVHLQLAMLHFEDGRFEKAATAARNGLRHAPNSALLQGVGRMVHKARSGPDWPRTYETKTQHYHIVSDIGRTTCVEAGKILEESYLAYTTTLARPPRSERENRRFKVYLFSGEASYQIYCRDLMGSTAPHTAGLYSPVLKQLLIWNLPERKDMLRTVRHEGWHQYLDSICDGQPTWVDEGMAEYYETAEYVGGRWKIGEVRRDHLVFLDGTQGEPKPLAEFLRGRHEAFYQDASVNYAQAWAFVHYLRHRSAETRKRFKLLFQKLLESRPWEEVIKEVFPAAELDAIEKDFRLYLTKLS